MTTTGVGREAENAAKDYLCQHGFRVLHRNWRTRWCEIDLIATKQKIIYFVEVKYRSTDQWGDGLDAITVRKIQQMQFAADFWVHENQWKGDYRLMAISATGDPPTIMRLVEI